MSMFQPLPADEILVRLSIPATHPACVGYAGRLFPSLERGGNKRG